ncbi:MAG: DUF3990 domain-containing protein [Muribaculaceae bacterium]|nr:DUF3990 domain-containing protein [Muribaculaceae bacterium]
MDIIEIYHAGTEIIRHPEIKFSRPDLDFGPGFYLTNIFEQAENWGLKRAEKRQNKGIINKYLLRQKDLFNTEGINIKIFDTYSEEWLDFITDNRSSGRKWEQWDYIEGGVADDRIIDTIDLYIAGFLDKETALKRLIYLKPNNQICINKQEILDDFLEFNGYLELD